MIKIRFICIVSFPTPIYICFPKESAHQIQTKHGDSFGYVQIFFLTLILKEVYCLGKNVSSTMNPLIYLCRL